MKSPGKSLPAVIPTTGPATGWWAGPPEFDGLMERVVTDGDGLAPYDPALSPAQAVGLQPLACVLYACEQLPELDGRHVGDHRAGIDRPAVLLRRQSRRARDTSPGRPDRPRGPRASSASTTVVRATSDRWVSQLAPDDRPDIVIEAVGHQVATLRPRHRCRRPGWHRLLLRGRRRRRYPISMRTMLRNNLTLKSGVTLDRRRMLELAGKFAAEHPGAAQQPT